jgi:hypothetical protein
MASFFGTLLVFPSDQDRLLLADGANPTSSRGEAQVYGERAADVHERGLAAIRLGEHPVSRQPDALPKGVVGIARFRELVGRVGGRDQAVLAVRNPGHVGSLSGQVPLVDVAVPDRFA